jgi:hypothetical protein
LLVVMGMIAIGGRASASSRPGEQGVFAGGGPVARVRERLDDSRRLQVDALAAEWLRVNGAS